MAGRGGDTTEPWYWQDDLFKLDFKESPLVVTEATSRSFWDDLTQSEGDSHALFASSPVTDSRYCNPSLFSFDMQGIDSQGSPSSDYGIQQNQRYKRRRMLQFSVARTDTLPPDSATPVLASGLGDCITVPFPTSPNLLWCTRNGQNPSTGPSRFKLKSQTPVTYPFALLKPYSAEGAVTLNDINKRLLSLPPRPVQGTIPIKERPLAQPGSGLSGKSVVACTKIHTEGNGTITIMRTKG